MSRYKLTRGERNARHEQMTRRRRKRGLPPPCHTPRWWNPTTKSCEHPDHDEVTT